METIGSVYANINSFTILNIISFFNPIAWVTLIYLILLKEGNFKI